MERNFDELATQNGQLNTQLVQFRKDTDASIQRLKTENKDLSSLNHVLKIEIEKLTTQIELIEKKNHLENEINEQFEHLIEQKTRYENDNTRLNDLVEKLREEIKENHSNFEQEFAEVYFLFMHSIFFLLVL